jgi:hypothetical protein
MRTLALFILAPAVTTLSAQTSPAITAWIHNTTGIKGSHYVNGNTTPVQDNSLANVQMVQFSSSSVYVSTNGIPAYVTGPYLDGNPAIAQPQNAIYKLPLNPVQNTGVPVATSPGNIGIFINGVSLFDYRDGASWKNSTGTMAGGPFGGQGDNVWNRDAVYAERTGFDCSKGHSAMGNYHHHQNPSAFRNDLLVISNICNTYNSDGLYVTDSTKHSPLLGFAYDGFPVYGPYAYKNTNGTGGAARMKTGYQLRNITVRTHYADGSDVIDGPPVNATYVLGYFKEDYEYVSGTGPDHLDNHNGRFCVTPEYPNGTYAYFLTVDKNWNSAYPYAVGPAFYGVKTGSKVTSITEAVTTYTPPAPSGLPEISSALKPEVFPVPCRDFITVRVNALLRENQEVRLVDLHGRIVQRAIIFAGSTSAQLDVNALSPGIYLVTLNGTTAQVPLRITVLR